MKSKMILTICIFLCASILVGCASQINGGETAVTTAKTPQTAVGQSSETTGSDSETVETQNTPETNETTSDIPADGFRWALQDSDRYYGSVFGDNEIVAVNVEIKEEDWNALCKNASAEEYYPASVTVNGIKLENVGFRTKGASSLAMVASSSSNRYGFKIKTDKYVKGQTLEGLDMFVLNASFTDASYMREYLTYAACAHLGMITPFLSYVDLCINGEPFGFYLMIESYDDSFVERSTNDEDAVLYKADGENCTLTSTDDGSGFEVKVGKDKQLDHIKELIRVLNGTTAENKEELEAIFDVDSALKGWAINTVFGNYDSYSGTKAHNYYLLWSDGKFSYIGWDYNMSIGGFSPDNGASVSADVTRALYDAKAGSRPLIEKLIAIDEYYERYIGYVNDLCAYCANFEETVKQISDRISEHVKADPTAYYTYDEYVENISKSEGGISTGGDRPDDGQNPGGNPFDPGQDPGGNPFDPGQDPGGNPFIPGQDPGGNPFIPGQNPGGNPFDPGQDPGGNPFNPGGDPGDIPLNPDNPGGGDNPVIPGGQIMPGGGMMHMKTCSIVDYILQRVDTIQKQLNGEEAQSPKTAAPET